MADPAVPVFLDTNVLVYAVGEPGTKRMRAKDLTSQPNNVISDQIIAEFVNVCLNKRILTPIETRGSARLFMGQFRLVPNGESVLVCGLAYHERYRLQWWDALVVAAAVEAGCATLYSEDMQDGQEIDGTTIVNPFPVAA